MNKEEKETPGGAPPAAAGGKALQFDGRWTELLPIVLVNLLLTIITIGIFRFWARTRVRRYLWSRARLYGEPLEYTGTGLELFVGFVVVFFVVLLPLTLIFFAAEMLSQSGRDLAGIFMLFATYLAIFWLIGAAVYRAQRYRMSRTQWRGIRGAQLERGYRYGAIALGFLFLNGFTLGLTAPVAAQTLYGYRMNRRYFGSGRFRFKAPVEAIYPTYFVCWILAVPTLFISLFWYYARYFSHIARHTAFEGLGFTFDIKPGQLFWFWFVNLLIMVFTLTLGSPFVAMRKIRFLAENLQVSGTLDFETIRQTDQAGPSIGEGLAEAFDVGGI